MRKSHFLIFLMVFMASCQAEEIEFEDYRPIVAVPLIHSTLDVYDVLERTDSLEELSVNDEGIIFLNYSGELISLRIDTIIAFPQVNQSQISSIGAGEAQLLEAGNDIEIPFNNFQLELSPSIETDELRVDTIILSSGSLAIDIEKIQDENLNLNFSLPNIESPQGQALSVVVQNSDFNDNDVYSELIDLSGYRVLPEHSPPMGNSISLEGEIIVSNNSENIAQAGDFVETGIELNNLGFETVWGYFGQVAANTDLDSVTIEIFENSIDGFFQLNEATIDLITSNSFGFPASVDFSTLQSINLNTGAEVNLDLEDDFQIGAALSPNSGPLIETFTIDENNSDITDILVPTPQTILFQLNGLANPGNLPPPSVSNFIDQDSRLDVAIDVELPLIGYAQDIVILDTLDAEIEFDEYEEVDSLELRFFSNNGFPVDAEIQLTFLDTNDVPIDFLFDGGFAGLSTFLVSGVMNDQVVIAPSEYTFNRTIDEAGAERLKDTKKIVIRSRLNTFESDGAYEVHFREEYELEVKLGVKIFGNIEL